jgi:hypothetical protein
MNRNITNNVIYISTAVDMSSNGSGAEGIVISWDKT